MNFSILENICSKMLEIVFFLVFCYYNSHAINLFDHLEFTAQILYPYSTPIDFNGDNDKELLI